jgi:hypothetical protein
MLQNKAIIMGVVATCAKISKPKFVCRSSYVIQLKKNSVVAMKRNITYTNTDVHNRVSSLFLLSFHYLLLVVLS